MSTETVPTATSRACALVIEDDGDLADVVAETLRQDAFEVVLAGSVEAALRVSERRPPDVALVDIMLPDGSGVDLARQLRDRLPALPVLFVSSLGATTDIVAALKAGGDDYVTKPFHPAELLARTRAVSQRAGVAWRPEWPTRPAATISPNGLEVDRANRSIYYEGQNVRCTALEFELFDALQAAPGQVLTHGFLNRRLWGYSNLTDSTLLKGHVGSLRRKLARVGASSVRIRTVYGVGYSYNPAASSADGASLWAGRVSEEASCGS